jgi:hypothetical protein
MEQDAYVSVVAGEHDHVRIGVAIQISCRDIYRLIARAEGDRLGK